MPKAAVIMYQNIFTSQPYRYSHFPKKDDSQRSKDSDLF